MVGSRQLSILLAVSDCDKLVGNGYQWIPEMVAWRVIKYKKLYTVTLQKWDFAYCTIGKIKEQAGISIFLTK